MTRKYGKTTKTALVFGVVRYLPPCGHVELQVFLILVDQLLRKQAT